MGISRRTALGFIAGNEEATERVYGEYKNLMFFVIASYVPSKDDCDDILSESFLKAMEHRGELKDPGKLKNRFSLIEFIFAFVCFLALCLLRRLEKNNRP